MWAVTAEREWSTDGLDGGGTGVVADKGLRGGERERIGGAGRRHALAKVIEAAAILDGRAQSGRVDVHHRATNRTRSPGRISDGGSLALSKTRTSVRPINRQPPGESKGYIDVCPSAIATDPAGPVRADEAGAARRSVDREHRNTRILGGTRGRTR